MILMYVRVVLMLVKIMCHFTSVFLFFVRTKLQSYQLYAIYHTTNTNSGILAKKIELLNKLSCDNVFKCPKQIITTANLSMSVKENENEFYFTHL